MKYVAIVILVVASLQLASAKIFERCELAEELVRQGFNKDHLRDWICLIEAHSRRDTSKVMPLYDGTTQWGLFQINDNYWCKSGQVGGLCNLPCESLLTDDITNSARCAAQIYHSRPNGFESWHGWRQFCTGPNPNLPDLSFCKPSVQYVPQFQTPFPPFSQQPLL